MSVAITARATACVAVSSSGYICRIASVRSAGPSDCSDQFGRFRPSIVYDAYPIGGPLFWQVCAKLT